MGVVLGFAVGLGLLLVWQGLRQPREIPVRRRGSRTDRIEELLNRAGIESVTPGQLALASVGTAAVSFLAAVLVSRSVAIAMAFAVFGALTPTSLVRYRVRRRSVELRELWPEVVENIASGVRAGLALPEALTEVGTRGPETLRRPFAQFGGDYRVTGRFDECLDRLKDRLADPVGDRVVESVRVARDVGGTDLGRLLRTLAVFLREDTRTRAELETRQGWTVNAARLALAAPWLMLALLALNPQAADAYDSAAGVVVLLLGGGVSVGAYRLMLRIGRLPEERRVLR